MRKSLEAGPHGAVGDTARLCGIARAEPANINPYAETFEGGLVGERGVVATAGSPPRAPSVDILGGAFEAGHVLTVRGPLALDVQLGYNVLATVAPDAARKPAEAAAYHRSVLHGPRLSFRLLGVPRPPSWRGFATPPDGWSFGLAAYAGAWWQGAARAAPAPFIGLALEGNLGT